MEIHTKDAHPVPVIYGRIVEQNKKQQIRITSSSPYFAESDESAGIDNADVSVTDSKGNHHLFSCTKDGYYESLRNFGAQEGVTYHLRVEMDFDGDGEMELYEAETTVPRRAGADSAAVSSIRLMGSRHFALNLYMQDPAEEKNFYLFRFVINDTISNDKIHEYIVFDDRMFNGNYLEGVTVHYFEEATEDEEDSEARERDRDREQYMVSPGFHIRLQVDNIEEGYYNFISECSREKNGENPFFGGPPSNITTNMSNGAVGYFTGYTICELETVVPE
jgi:hypothetical protein